MIIYALASFSDLEVNRFKVGETASVPGVLKRLNDFDKGPERIYVQAMWDIGDSATCSDKVLHKALKDRKCRREWFEGITLEEVHNLLIVFFGPNVKRIK